MKACLYFLKRYQNCLQLFYLALSQSLNEIVSEFTICDCCTIRTDLTYIALYSQVITYAVA
jgi:hypothetical protein